MKTLFQRIRWYWLPPYLVLLFAFWQRQGPIFAITLGLAGPLLGLLIELRDRRRRQRALGGHLSNESVERRQSSE